MSNGVSVQPAQPVKEAYGFFVGNVDQQAVQRVANAITIGTNNGIETIHMLFQSSGGIVGDGICLYNIFQSTPIHIILYNAGVIASIGVIAYLGADERKSDPRATFMIHRTNFSPMAATSDRLQSAANAAILDDRRIEAILRDHITLSQDQWDVHKMTDLWLSADEAETCGLVTVIDDFSPPKGTQLFYLGPA